MSGYSTVGPDDLYGERVRKYNELRDKQELKYMSDRLKHTKLYSPYQIIPDEMWLRLNRRPVRAPADEKDWEREWEQRQLDNALVEQDKNVPRTYPISILDKNLTGRDKVLERLQNSSESVASKSVASESVASEQVALPTGFGKKQRIKGGKKLKIKATPKAKPKAK